MDKSMGIYKWKDVNLLGRIWSRDFLLKVWVFFIGFPLFINVGGPEVIGLGTSVFSNQPGINLPISFFIMIWLLLATTYKKIVLREKWIITSLTKQYIFLFYVCFLLAFFGILISNKITDLIFVFQMTVPLLVYIIITNYIDCIKKFEFIIKIMVVGAIIGFILLVISNIVNYGLEILLGSKPLTDEVFFLTVYQIYDYYPVVIAVIAILLFNWFLNSESFYKKNLLFILFIIAIIVMTKLNSRNALLAFGISFSLLVFFGNLRYRLKLILAFLSFGVLLVLYSLNLSVFHRILNANNSISVRLERLEQGLHQVYSHPLFGSMFRSDEITGFHNQYLELAGNAGIFITVAFFSFLLMFIFRTAKYIKRQNNKQLKSISVSIVCIIIGILLGSNIAQSNFTQPMSSFLIWFLIGCQDSLNRLKERSDI
ncbi:O-antigen ligase family protein [Aquibacillus albus]|nr:O-antigen ligase family protein [Aquibacillus albus]